MVTKMDARAARWAVPLFAASLAASTIMAACSDDDSTGPGGDAFSAEEQRLNAAVTKERMDGHIAYLASDALEGRGPGSMGDEMATTYLANEMQKIGLKPGGDNGTFLQNVPLVGIKAEVPSMVEFVSQRATENKVQLTVPNDLVIMAGMQEPKVAISAAELVFVGYGIVAPEYNWDDYKNVDVKGKIVVVMNNDPSTDGTLFQGQTRLWYGRWDYKYFQAAKKGAKGAIIIHTTPSAGYGWNVVVSSNHRERFELPPTDEPRTSAKMWAQEEAARKLVALGGEDLDALRQAAESREFQPRPLGVSMSLEFDNTMRQIKSNNVIGVLEGSDAELKTEAVVYTAHHDHLGKGAPINNDPIYNGAIDNASGMGQILAIAGAAVTAQPKPRRSMVFMFVGAEEQGLLGSQYYCQRPTFAPGRIAANLNTDSANMLGATKDLGFIGLGKSSLDDVVIAVAKAQGRTVHGDAYPDRGSYYRSDQFSFARIGVPGIYAKGGPEFIGQEPGWGQKQALDYETHRYHQPSDHYNPAWNYDGTIQDAQLLLIAGLRIANTTALPAWKPDDEFANIQRPR